MRKGVFSLVVGAVLAVCVALVGQAPASASHGGTHRLHLEVVTCHEEHDPVGSDELELRIDDRVVWEQGDVDGGDTLSIKDRDGKEVTRNFTSVVTVQLRELDRLSGADDLGTRVVRASEASRNAPTREMRFKGCTVYYHVHAR